MKNFQSILVGVDLTPEGEVAPGCLTAILEGAWLAAATGARLTLAHVVNLAEDVHATTRVQPQSSWTLRTQTLEAALANMAAELRASEVSTKVLVGKDWQTLVQEVQAQGHDLLVVGTRARNLAGRAIFGSAGQELLRHCPCPVFVVKRREHATYANVLVAHDLSTVGSQALRLGTEMATLFGAKLHVLHAIEHAASQRLLDTASAEEIAQHRASVLGRIKDESDALVATGPQTVIAAVDGAPHSAILDYINKHAIDLVCMGTVARRGLAAFVPGNTAERALRWIGCSLLAVKPPGFGSMSAPSETRAAEPERTPRRHDA